MKLRRLACTAAVLTTVAFSVAGCSKTVDLDSLEDQVSGFYTDTVGEDPDDVSCPDDIDAEKGATGTCTVTAGDTEYVVDVKVESIDGDTVNFSLEVEDPDAEAE
ncbi:DUF4333 domain-containing protein [Nocardioides sp.]|uniref:DUF4333 domain-containing protein n=1 Tax=Nocardioides sp. TaxID=35761 RepID=UPI00271ADFC0|nr:DUF4333 domain-containing protein [Nocardioides sp.]MDO9456499.1 DUF4333 domain-containing protein [Nocardioides sp.]